MRSEALLLLTALLWGFAFVAQRKGTEFMDPLLFNGIRFALGTVVVGILAGKSKGKTVRTPFPWLLGLVLFIAVTAQQVGLVFTTAGAAGFITGLYVVIVPIIGYFRKQPLSRTIIISVLLAVIGLYFISARQELTASLGNFIVLIGAFFWAWHVQLVDKYTKEHDTLQLAFGQYSFCALASLALGVIYNMFQNPGFLFSCRNCLAIENAAVPILYSGIASVGIAFTLQVHAQKLVPPVPATIILSLEGVFALFGGWLLLKEDVTFSILLGAGLLFAAMLISIRSKFTKPTF
jgi:drug/metabolite transporter (DMT)-like permease